MKNLLKPSIYWLFVFIPIAFVLEQSHASAPWIFFSGALSIVPITRLIGKSTEQLATYTRDAVGGLLNATFGNFARIDHRYDCPMGRIAPNGFGLPRWSDPREFVAGDGRILSGGWHKISQSGL